MGNPIESFKGATEKLFAQFGSIVDVTTQGTETEDDWGEPIFTGGVTTPAIAIIDSYNRFSRVKVSGRSLAAGSIIFYFEDTVTVTETDTITYKLKDYKVESIESVDASNSSIVHIVIASLK